ncbi:MAG TPA: hypothetical protein VF901_18035 [Bradyrhizobium sp.]
MTDVGQIKDAVRQTMTDQFGAVKVRDITVNEETDDFGDALLRIDVVFDGPTLNPAGFVRNLRPRLTDIREFAFPLLTFISSSELK